MIMTMTTSTGTARAQDEQVDEVAVLTPEEEAELGDVIVETDEDLRRGRGIPWEQFLAERSHRRGR